MWMSEVEMKVWIRGRSECLIAFQAASMSWPAVRARPQITGPSTCLGDRLDRREVAGRGDREAGLDDVDTQPRELVGDLQLLLDVERDARRLLAVAQRRVEDVDAVRLLAVGARCSGRPHGLCVISRYLLLLFLPIPVALCGPSPRTSLFPPKGEEKEERGAQPEVASARGLVTSDRVLTTTIVTH